MLCVFVNNIFAEDNKESKEQTNKIENNENTEYNGFLTPIAMSLNILPFGIGSHIQGDVPSSLYLLVSDIVIIPMFLASINENSGQFWDQDTLYFSGGILLLNRVLGIFVFPLYHHFSMKNDSKAFNIEKEKESPYIPVCLNILPFGFGSLYQGDTSGFEILFAMNAIGVCSLVSHLLTYDKDRQDDYLSPFVILPAIILLPLSKILGVYFPLSYNPKNEVKEVKSEGKSLYMGMCLNILPFGCGSLYQGDTTGFVTLVTLDSIAIICTFAYPGAKSKGTDAIILGTALMSFIWGRILGILIFPLVYDSSSKTVKSDDSYSTSQIASYAYYKDFHNLISEKSNVPNYRKIQDKLKIELPLVNMNF